MGHGLRSRRFAEGPSYGFQNRDQIVILADADEPADSLVRLPAGFDVQVDPP